LELEASPPLTSGYPFLPNRSIMEQRGPPAASSVTQFDSDQNHAPSLFPYPSVTDPK